MSWVEDELELGKRSKINAEKELNFGRLYIGEPIDALLVEAFFCRMAVAKTFGARGSKLQPSDQDNASKHRLNDNLTQIVLSNKNWNLVYLA